MKRSFNEGRWEEEEHEAFLDGLKRFGKNWKKVSDRVVTRSEMQVRTHAQKYFQKIATEYRRQGRVVPVAVKSTATNVADDFEWLNSGMTSSESPVSYPKRRKVCEEPMEKIDCECDAYKCFVCFWLNLVEMEKRTQECSFVDPFDVPLSESRSTNWNSTTDLELEFLGVC